MTATPPFTPSTAQPPSYKLMLLVLLHLSLYWGCLISFPFVTNDMAKILLGGTFHSEVLLLICLMCLRIIPPWQMVAISFAMLLLIWVHGRALGDGIGFLISLIPQFGLMIAWNANYRLRGGNVLWVAPEMQSEQPTYARISLRHIFGGMFAVSVSLGILQNPWVNQSAHSLVQLGRNSAISIVWLFAWIGLPICLLITSLHVSLSPTKLIPNLWLMVPLVTLNSLVWLPFNNPLNLYFCLLASALQTAIFLCTWLELRASGYQLRYRELTQVPPDVPVEKPLSSDEPYSGESGVSQSSS